MKLRSCGAGFEEARMSTVRSRLLFSMSFDNRTWRRHTKAPKDERSHRRANYCNWEAATDWQLAAQKPHQTLKREYDLRGSDHGPTVLYMPSWLATSTLPTSHPFTLQTSIDCIILYSVRFSDVHLFTWIIPCDNLEYWLTTLSQRSPITLPMEPRTCTSYEARPAQSEADWPDWS